MTHQYLLAHDLGTTGNKATLFDVTESAVKASTFQGYPTDYSQPGQAEQDPADWQAAIWQCTRRLIDQSGIDPAHIAAVSFSGHMQGALLVDRQGKPLGKCIIWADQRATAQADFIASACGSENLYRRTGQRISPTYTAPKVMWIKEHYPELYKQAHKILQPKDYAAFLLSGVFATDHSDASSTLFFDLTERRWMSDVIQAMGLDITLLPEAYPSTTVIGHVTKEAAAASGLVTGTPVVSAAGMGLVRRSGLVPSERARHTLISARRPGLRLQAVSRFSTRSSAPSPLPISCPITASRSEPCKRRAEPTTGCSVFCTEMNPPRY